MRILVMRLVSTPSLFSHLFLAPGPALDPLEDDLGRGAQVDDQVDVEVELGALAEEVVPLAQHAELGGRHLAPWK